MTFKAQKYRNPIPARDRAIILLAEVGHNLGMGNDLAIELWAMEGLGLAEREAIKHNGRDYSHFKPTAYCRREAMQLRIKHNRLIMEGHLYRQDWSDHPRSPT